MLVDAIIAALAQRPVSTLLTSSHHLPQNLCMSTWDVHSSLEIAFHRTGSGTVEFPGSGLTSFTPGTIEIYAPQLGHKQVMHAAGQDDFIHIATLPAFAALAGSSLVLPAPPDEQVAAEFGRLTRPRGTLSRLEAVERDHRVSALLLRLLGSATLREHTPRLGAAEHHARDARIYIRSHALTIGRIDEVAQALAISPSHLRHAFTATFGHSLVRELMEARVAVAEELLQTTDAPLAVIAQRCGLGNEGYLCRVVRQLRGISPAALRRATPP